MRKSTLFILVTTVEIIVLMSLCIVHPLITAKHHGDVLAEQAVLVSKLGLTDLCLFTEAPYTRNVSMADNFSAFQDSPMEYEHFPSGSMTMPPQLMENQATPGNK